MKIILKKRNSTFISNVLVLILVPYQLYKLHLIAPVTSEEVLKALNDIDGMKSSGHNGFNACFLEKSRPVIDSNVTDPVLKFFESIMWVFLE